MTAADVQVEAQLAPPAAIAAVDLHRSFRAGGSAIEVIRGLTFEAARGEFVAVMGPSGAGKSTFLHLLGLLDQPDQGTVMVNGAPAGALTDAARSRLRGRSIGFVFQFFHLLPGFDALGNLAVAGTVTGMRRSEARRRASELLDAVGLTHRARHLASELSGGERQRVAIARALVNDPPILLADEPSGNLDSRSGEQVLDLLVNLKDGHRTLVMVTHDPEVAAHADRIVTMRDGRLLPHGAEQIERR